MAASQKTAKVTASAPAGPDYYRVLHGAVGGWEQGTSLSSDDLSGIDVGRLLRLGAIEPTQEPIKDVTPVADEPGDVPAEPAGGE